jgi:hypothetical protein
MNTNLALSKEALVTLAIQAFDKGQKKSLHAAAIAFGAPIDLTYQGQTTSIDTRGFDLSNCHKQVICIAHTTKHCTVATSCSCCIRVAAQRVI